MNEQEPPFFNHEKLDVYQEAINFIAWLSVFLESTPNIGDTKNQIDRASSSIALNIAEGNGKFTPKDRSHFFDIAHGSALESAAALDVIVAKGKATPKTIRPGKLHLQRIVSMLMGLIKSNTPRPYQKTPTNPPVS